jgi:hypothetical protein
MFYAKPLQWPLVKAVLPTQAVRQVALHGRCDSLVETNADVVTDYNFRVIANKPEADFKLMGPTDLNPAHVQDPLSSFEVTMPAHTWDKVLVSRYRYLTFPTPEQEHYPVYNVPKSAVTTTATSLYGPLSVRLDGSDVKCKYTLATNTHNAFAVGLPKLMVNESNTTILDTLPKRNRLVLHDLADVPFDKPNLTLTTDVTFDSYGMFSQYFRQKSTHVGPLVEEVVYDTSAGRVTLVRQPIDTNRFQSFAAYIYDNDKATTKLLTSNFQLMVNSQQVTSNGIPTDSSGVKMAMPYFYRYRLYYPLLTLPAGVDTHRIRFRATAGEQYILGCGANRHVEVEVTDLEKTTNLNYYARP